LKNYAIDCTKESVRFSKIFTTKKAVEYFQDPPMKTKIEKKLSTKIKTIRIQNG